MCVAGGRELELSENQLDGSIPSTVFGMTALTMLHLAQNPLTGTIPYTVGFMTALIDVVISATAVGGTIPATISQLTALTALNLGNNGGLWSGIPSTIGLLSRLQYALLARVIGCVHRRWGHTWKNYLVEHVICNNTLGWN